MSFRTKILGLSLMGIVVTGAISIAVLAMQKSQRQSEISEELNQLSRREAAKIARDVYLMVQVYHEKLRRELHNGLNVARKVFQETGPVSLAAETVGWDITNQFTKQRRQVVLAGLRLGSEWLGPNRDADNAFPVVDEVNSLLGCTCTIFQRINAAGDMLRVCTNIRETDGTRAIGTYIPAVNPDGTPNPVVSAVLRGETYVGRAYVVNDWYLTAYEPIRDADEKLIGMLYIGVKQEDVPDLRKGILEIVVGNTGYVSVLNGSGAQRGRSVILGKGQCCGENLWDARDANGMYFVQSLVGKALQTARGTCAFERYAWRNKGESDVRWKTAAVTYFEPWDWVIAATANEDDYQDAVDQVTRSFNRLLLWTMGASMVAMILCGGVSRWLTRRITKPLLHAVRVMEEVAEGDYTKRLEVAGADEIGRMSVAVNTAVEATAKLVQDLKDAAERERKALEERAEHQRKLAEAQRQGLMLRRLEGVNRLQEELILPAPLEEKFKKITQTAVELLDLDFCRIWSVRPGDLCDSGCVHAGASDETRRCPRRDRCLHLLASAGRYNHTDGDHRRVPLGLYKIGRIATGEEKKRATNNVTTDPNVVDHAWAERLGLVSFAGYKLHDARGKTTGVLAMFAKRPVSEEDDAFLSHLAETTSKVIMDHHAEEELRQAQKLEGVGQLAGGVAHEFNNLLQVIDGYTCAGMEGLAPEEDRYADLEQVRKAAERAAALTRQLLGFSRRRAIEPKSTDANQVVRDLAKLIRPAIGEHIVLDLAFGTPAGTVYADAGELQQALLNLCLNARDAMPSGGNLVLKTEKAVVTEPLWDSQFDIKPGTYVVFSVSDTGCGIPRDIQQRIFEPFFTTKEVGKGTGLGLALVYGVVRQHKGAIHLYSEVGIGTTFKLYLPPGDGEAEEAREEEAGSMLRGSETILVAEDEPMVRNLTVRTLEKAGYTVLAASDGEEALEVFEEHRSEIALVVLDAIMPKLTGHEVHRRIKEVSPETKVICSTGYDRETSRSECLVRENVPLLQKPFTARTLLSTVRETLDAQILCQLISHTVS